eukprot:scaffold101330_cov28-Tisochrysis_lutea.AAC.2
MHRRGSLEVSALDLDRRAWIAARDHYLGSSTGFASLFLCDTSSRCSVADSIACPASLRVVGITRMTNGAASGFTQSANLSRTPFTSRSHIPSPPRLAFWCAFQELSVVRLQAAP